MALQILSGKGEVQIMPLRILSGKREVQIMSFRKLSGKCHFLLRFCTRNWSETYTISKKLCKLPLRYNARPFLVYLQVFWRECREPSTNSMRSHASLQPRAVNCAVQHLRGFRLRPGISPASEFCEFASYMCCLSFVVIKVPDCVKRKGVLVLSSGQPSQTYVSNIPYSNKSNITSILGYFRK